MKKATYAIWIGVGAAVLLIASYFALVAAGVKIVPIDAMMVAAMLAFVSSATILALILLNQAEKKKEKAALTLGDLSKNSYAHFPRRGEENVLYMVVQPDTEIDELDVIQNGEAYENKEIFLTIKRSRGKTVFNPILLKKLFEALKGYGGFLHMLLVNEREDYIGYLPAARVRTDFTGDAAESKISKFIIDVLDAPESSVILREIDGLSIHDCIFEHEQVVDALKRVAINFISGLVVFKGKGTDKGFHKPIGVIFATDLIKFVEGVKKPD
jgi:hypothetical protein